MGSHNSRTNADQAPTATPGNCAAPLRWPVVSLCCWLIAGLLPPLGCSESGPQRATVSGKVLVDGQPLQHGSINFLPTEGNDGPTAGAAIEDGRYQIEREKGVTLGKNLVQIHCVQKTGRKIPDRLSDELVDEWAEMLPAEYNSRSTLVRDITPGTNTLDFDLKGKKPAE